MAKTILVDTGFWYALYEKRDKFHHQAKQMVAVLKKQTILLPFPSLYETLNTRFTDRKDYMYAFEQFLNESEVNFIDDRKYKNKALKLVFEYNKIGKRTFSLVDIILREILLDDSFKIDYLLTFNVGDFIDICIKRKIELFK